MPTLTPEQQDEDLKNPSQQDFLRDFEHRGTLSEQELADRRANHIGGNSQQQVDSNEKKALNDSAAGKAAVTAASTAASTVASPAAGRIVSYLGKIKTKKGGASAGAIAIIIAFILLITGIGGESMLLIQFKETLANKFNDTMLVMDKRSNLIIKKKIAKITRTSCTVKALCRLDGMSARQIKSLERPGVDIKVNTKGEPNIFGRSEVTSLTMPDGLEVTSGNIEEVLHSNPKARGVLYRGFNPSRVAFATTPFKNLLRRLGITKQKNVSGTTKEQLDESMKKSMAGETANSGGRVTVSEDANGNKIYVDENGNPITPEQAAKLNNVADVYEKAALDAKSSGKKVAIDLAKGSTLSVLTAGAGSIDSLCTGYGLIRTVGYGAKVLGALQLIRFAYTFLNTADASKAGESTGEEVSYVATKITSQDQNGETGTDSFGYKYASNGDTLLPTDETKRANIFQYSTAAGLGATLIKFTSLLNKYTDNAPKNVCKNVKNPWAQGGMLVGGVILTVLTWGSTSIPGAVAAGVTSVAVAALAAIATPLLINYAAGTLVTSDTIGGDAVNAAVSGMGALNSQNSQIQALSPLTKEEAVVYEKNTNQVLALNNAAEASLVSPFDITNTASPTYKVASTLRSSLASSSSVLANIFSAPQNLISRSFQSIWAPAKAAADPTAQYNICTDEDYVKEGFAADPFCNIRYGLNSSSLSQDPQAVIDWMYKNGHINDDGSPKSEAYQNFIKNCIDRVSPIGDSGADLQTSDGLECVQGRTGYNPDFDYFRVYYTDTVINDYIDGENTPMTTAATAAAAPVSTPLTGAFQGLYANGQIPASALCDLGPLWPGEMLRCDAQAAFLKLNTAYLAQFGKNICVTDSYRSYAQQVAIKKTKGNLAAVPGTSNHGWGQALDLGCGIQTFNTAQYNWMKQNAGTYGWKHPAWAEPGGIKPEPWHWEYGV